MENADTPVRVAMRQASEDVAALGLVGRWVDEAGLLRGEAAGAKVVMVPRVLAMSDAAIRLLREGGWTVLADGPVGTHDARLRPRAGAVTLGTAVTPEGRRAAIAAAFKAQGGVAPPIALAAGGAPGFLRREIGGMTVIGAISGLAEARGDEAPAIYALGGTRLVRDIRGDGDWQEADRLVLRLDAAGPALWAVSEDVPEGPTVEGPTRAEAGRSAVLKVGGGAAAVLRVEVRDPAGMMVPGYSAVVMPEGKTVAFVVPFAENDRLGRWVVGVRDVLGGGVMAWGIVLGGGSGRGGMGLSSGDTPEQAGQ